MIWHYSKNGLYSVKTGYLVVMEKILGREFGVVGTIWKRIWKLHVPPKIKSFLWRVCRNVFPCRYRLFSKGIDCPISCVNYGTGVESVWHLFVDCSFARQCWGVTSLSQIVVASSASLGGFVAWLSNIMENVEEDER